MNSFTTYATYIIFVAWSVSCANSYSKVESKIEWEAFKNEYGKLILYVVNWCLLVIGCFTHCCVGSFDATC